MSIYCHECYRVETKWVCCEKNDKNNKHCHNCISNESRCYIQCPKCNKIFNLCGIYFILSDYLQKEKEKNMILMEKIKEIQKEKIEPLIERKPKPKMIFRCGTARFKEKLFTRSRIWELENQIRQNQDNNNNNIKKISALEKELSELKEKYKCLQSPKRKDKFEDKEIELICNFKEENNFSYNQKINLSDNFSCFINGLKLMLCSNIDTYRFKFNGKDIDKEKNLKDNGILENNIISIEKIF